MFTAILAVALSCAGGSAAPPASPGTDPEQGVLLLRNGQLVEGRVVRREDRYEVALPNGELRIPVAQVEALCRDVGEAYRTRRAVVQRGSVADHIELAQWCLRYGLIDEAEKERAEIRALQPDHPILRLLARRIALERRASPSGSRSESGSPADEVVSAVERAGQRPAAELRGDEPGQPERGEPAELPSAEDLERLVRAMPPGTVELFNNSIQPLLLSQCGTAGCHGLHADHEFVLVRPRVGEVSARRVAQQNLRAVLEWVDLDEPSSSPLLTIPTRRHGGGSTPIFTTRQLRAYRHLVEWVYRVAGGDEADVRAIARLMQGRTPASAGGGQGPPQEVSARPPSAGRVRGSIDFAPPMGQAPRPWELEFGATEPRSLSQLPRPVDYPPESLSECDEPRVHWGGHGSGEHDRGDVVPAWHAEPRPDSSEGAMGPVRPWPAMNEPAPVTLEDLDAQPRVRRGNPLPGYRPADPFDPEIFNRRYHPRPASE